LSGAPAIHPGCPRLLYLCDRGVFSVPARHPAVDRDPAGPATDGGGVSGGPPATSVSAQSPAGAVRGDERTPAHPAVARGRPALRREPVLASLRWEAPVGRSCVAWVPSSRPEVACAEPPREIEAPASLPFSVLAWLCSPPCSSSSVSSGLLSICVKNHHLSCHRVTSRAKSLSRTIPVTVSRPNRARSGSPQSAGGRQYGAMGGAAAAVALGSVHSLRFAAETRLTPWGSLPAPPADTAHAAHTSRR
jgi:hypothetical protein